MNAKAVIDRLAALADKRHRDKLAHFGIADKRALGVSVPKIRALAKELGKNQKLAAALWKTRVHEARILAPLIAEPELVTGDQLDTWATQIDSWDICDGFCSSLVVKTPFAAAKVSEWCAREEEFVRRAGFVVIAALAVQDKAAPDADFERFFPLFLTHASDGRNFVKKAINWALREVGKRNRRLNRQAIALAGRIQSLQTPSARWIASDALRELQSESVQTRLERRSVRQ